MASDARDDEILELFRSESTEQLDALETATSRLETDPTDEDALETARRQAHNLKGAARILGYQDIEAIAHHLEDMLDLADQAEGLSDADIQALREALDALERLVDATATPQASPEVSVPDVLSTLENRKQEPADQQEEGVPPAATAEEEEPSPETGDEDQPRDALDRAREHQIQTVRVDPHRLDVLGRRASELSAAVQRLRTLGSDLREARETADEVAEVVREGLETGKVPVAQSLRRLTEGLSDGLAALLQQVENDAADLDRLADAIDSDVQEVRLLPMSTMFNLFARAVRDLAREQGKRVEVSLEGGTVRADKHVLEELRNPLMHMVRNAVDHGIETPEERREAGKDPVGHVRLVARRTPEHLVVEVEDDGRGIDPDEIRRMARETDRFTADQLAAMDDEEVSELVFDAGFTTRDTVSEVSGRGVGLRTVAESADELHGSVHLDSTPGQGTRVSLDVPVELSTVHALLVRVGSHTYGLPIDAVHRILNVSPQDVERSGGRATIEAHGSAVPVVDLGAALDLRAPQADPFGEGARPCVLLRTPDRDVGIIVDDLVREEELVVEPLSSVLGTVRTVTGASVMGEGEVCLVLDPVELATLIEASGVLFQRRG